MHKYAQGEHLLLPGRKVALGRRELETEHGGRSSNDTNFNSQWATGHKLAADELEHPTTILDYTHHLVPLTVGAAVSVLPISSGK